MQSKEINSIIKQLKTDAEVFKQDSNNVLHENIMHAVDKQRIGVAHDVDDQKKWTVYQWLIPTGVALATLLFVSLNIDQSGINRKIDTELFVDVQEISTVANIVSQLHVAELPEVLEIKLTNNIMSEQKALIKDFKYFKNLFSLTDVKVDS